MFWLHIRSPDGVQAEFTVESATVALDLALRSGRTGLSWRAEHRSRQHTARLSLAALRRRAVTAACADEEERRLLDEVEWVHQLLMTARLN